MLKNVLVILSTTKSTGEYIKNQLDAVFGECLKISVVVAGDDIAAHSIKSSLVLVTSTVILDEVSKYISRDSRVLTPQRMVDSSQIINLYDIPDDNDVLVVNTSKKVTEESIEQLILYGFTNLKFHSYFPGIKSYKKDCKYIITFGELQLVPYYENNPQILNLNSRPIDIGTCVDIAIEFGIYDKIRHNLILSFFRPIIELSHKFAVQYHENMLLSENLHHMMSLYKIGLVLLNKNKKLIFYNDIARRVLKITNNESIYLENILAEKNLDTAKPFFYEINTNNYYFETVINNSKTNTNTLLLISSVKKIESLGQKYRSLLADKGLVAEHTFDDIIYGNSPLMDDLIKLAKEFAKSDSTVFIYGESGCGKELIAQAIHNASNRANEAFVAINFAAISETLAESELFGYEDGAFTGAKRGGKKGLFEMANKGTVFIDEIGDASMDMQKKLLRVLQERKVFPLGGSKVVPIDVRIISATNQNIRELVDKKLFREDLYYRLNVLPINVPPLRNRPADIIELFNHFLKLQGIVIKLPDKIIDCLINYRWQGNVRELKNVAEYISNIIKWDANWEDRLISLLAMAENNFVPKDDTEVIIQKLEKTGDLRAYIKILEIINSFTVSCTRLDIKEKLQELYMYHFSESQIKRMLINLKALDLIGAVTGKGTFMLAKGKQLIAYYHNRV